MAPNYSSDESVGARYIERQSHVLAAQIELLYKNANTGVAVTLLAAPVLAYYQSSTVPHRVLLSWLVYMLLISGARFVLSRRYRHASLKSAHVREWGKTFAVGAGLAGLGWGAAGIVLFTAEHLTSQMFLIF